MKPYEIMRIKMAFFVQCITKNWNKLLKFSNFSKSINETDLRSRKKCAKVKLTVIFKWNCFFFMKIIMSLFVFSLIHSTQTILFWYIQIKCSLTNTNTFREREKTVRIARMMKWIGNKKTENLKCVHKMQPVNVMTYTAAYESLILNPHFLRIWWTHTAVT